MRTLTAGAIVVFLFAYRVLAGPAMWTSQKTGDLAFADCASRAVTALNSRGFSWHKDGSRFWTGASATFTATVNCYELSSVRSIVTVTVAGGSQDDATKMVMALERTIWGDASDGFLGTWYRNGSAAHIEQGDVNLTCVNEFGNRSHCVVNGRAIHATDWNVTGTLSEDGKRLQWSNNTSWSRDNTSRLSATRFLGAWFRNGSRALIEQDDDGLACINEFGNRSRCTLTSANTIQAVEWNVAGTLSNDGRRIEWNNGTSWSR